MASLNKTNNKSSSQLELRTGKRDTIQTNHDLNHYEDEEEKRVEIIGRFTGKGVMSSKNKTEVNQSSSKKNIIIANRLSINDKIQRGYKHEEKGVVNMKYFNKTLVPVKITCHF
mmetsp:Transcript_2607/g.3054  ORF Transcript_2607/g.3054 Transcript_2607/m.3054 type:complete len:114 (+) Transcript_2607:25-366(+)